MQKSRSRNFGKLKKLPAASWLNNNLSAPRTLAAVAE